MAEFILDYTQEFFRGTDIRCRLKVSEDIPRLRVAAEQRHDVFLAVKEALNNAVKHARASEVQLQLDYSDSVFTVMLQDNGRGFAAAEMRGTGPGLENMRARAENLKGRFDLADRPRSRNGNPHGVQLYEWSHTKWRMNERQHPGCCSLRPASHLHPSIHHIMRIAVVKPHQD